MLRRRIRQSPAPRVFASAQVLQVFRRYLQWPGSSEQGGILLGEVFPSTHTILLREATEPGPGDQATAVSWERDQSHANELIRKVWEESDGLINYVGEWHTHSQRHPQPSPKDRITMGKLARGTGLVTDGLILVIVGWDSNWTGYWTPTGYQQIELLSGDDSLTLLPVAHLD